jgi:ribosomal protein S21|tara:strand:+ start:99 stop:344 length:246 start_codon:yes stop_codon:yes gene_type:complete
MKKAARVVVKAKECRGNHERMIRRFIKKTKKERIVEIAREKRYYKKPSILKKEKQARAKKLRLKEQQKQLRAQERRTRKKR